MLMVVVIVLDCDVYGGGRVLQICNRQLFVNSKSLDLRFWRKNCENYFTIEIVARLCKSHQSAFFFFLLSGVT